MVLLGIGFLSVEALAIMAARSVALANRNSEYAVAASHHMEIALDSIRAASPVPPAGVTITAPPYPTCGTATVDATPRTFEIVRTIARDPVDGGLAVTVEAVPKSTAAAQPAKFELVNKVFIPADAPAPGC